MNAAYSLIIDNTPVYLYNGWILIHSLIKNGKVDSKNIYVNFTPDVAIKWKDKILSLGVNIKDIEPFGDGKYCNKASQLAHFISTHYDFIILLDTDIIFIEPIELSSLPLGISGKIVDLPNPPLEILQEIYLEAGFQKMPDSLATDLKKDQLTFTGNFNGGLYIIHSNYIETIDLGWKKWIKWLLKNTIPLERVDKTQHIDQIAFSMAIHEYDLPTFNLSSDYNCPIHKTLAFDVSAKVIHHHNVLNATGQILNKNPSLSLLSDSINKGNSLIGSVFDDFIFWEYRYFTNPELGSGQGSRGELINVKKNLLYPYLHLYDSKKVLDVGCGDLEVMKDASLKNYTGLDLSDEVIQLSKNKRPDWKFVACSLLELTASDFDLIICLDVLIHQPTFEDYNTLVEQLISKCKGDIIVGGYNDTPQYSSFMTFYYEPLRDTLENIDKDLFIEEIGEYRDITLFFVATSPSSNKNDIEVTNLAKGFSLSTNSSLLLEYVSFSRKTIGFFPKTTIRIFEYPWVIEQAASFFSDITDKQFLDIGAGVCALPIWFAEGGANVTTIDLHQNIREIEAIDSWNEWGFLDYSVFNERITSLNQDAASLNLSSNYDLIYSVSVLEHIQVKTRKKILSNCYHWLNSDGILILTFDLIPGTDKLWNLSEGKLVEDYEIHGTLIDIKNELTYLGFKLIFEQTQREIFQSRTDVYYLVAKK